MECAPESAGKLALESDMWLLMGEMERYYCALKRAFV